MKGNDDKRGLKSVVNLKPRPNDLEARIRTIAEDSSKVFYKIHASERMEERGIVMEDVYRVLQTGFIEPETIEAGRSKGEWQCKMTKQIRGAREVGVVTIVVQNEKLFVKSVMWEDPR